MYVLADISEASPLNTVLYSWIIILENLKEILSAMEEIVHRTKSLFDQTTKQ